MRWTYLKAIDMFFGSKIRFQQYLKDFLKFFCFLMVFTILNVSALSVTYEEVSSNLETAEEKLEDMKENQIPVSKAEHIFEDAEDSLDSQRSLESMGKDPDYEGVQELIYRLFEISENSLRARDDLNVLEERINELRQDDTFEIQEAEMSYERAVEEFENQKFESALESVEETYEKISEPGLPAIRLTDFFHIPCFKSSSAPGIYVSIYVS